MADKKIKGIVVEIGGDTTKLGKALQDVESQASNLSGELGQINRLLKLDPGNADLLSQKQKVLADAVANTAKKLETLQAAEKQVQAQFERGEVSQEQVRALQREIIATTKKLDGYNQAVKETADAIDNLGKTAEDTAGDTKKAAEGVDELGDAAEKAEKSSGNLGSTLAGAAKAGLTAVATAASGIVAGLVASAEATRDYRREIGKLETAYTTAGHSTAAAMSTYQALQGVLGETDQAVEAANHIAKIAQNEADLSAWTDICTGVYATFGASLPIEGLTEAANETAKTGTLTGQLADALNWAGVSEDDFSAALGQCSTEQERQSLIMDTLSGLYGTAAETYRETNAEVIRANEANEAWTASMAGVGGAIEPVLSTIKLMGAQLLGDAVPGVQALADAFGGLLDGSNANAASDFGAALSDLVSGLAQKITTALPVIADVGISLVSTLVGSLAQQIPTILGVGAEIVLKIAEGIVTNLPAMAQGALDLLSGLVNSFQVGLPLLIAKGGEMLMQLSAGFAQQIPTFLSQSLDMLQGLADTLYNAAPGLIEMGFNVLSNLVQGITDALPTLIAKGPEIISKFANIINDNFPTILQKGVQLIGQLIIGIVKAIPSLIANVPKIIKAIVDVWQAFNWLSLGTKAITFLKNGITGMIGAVKNAGKSVLDGAVGAIKELPSKLGNIAMDAMRGLMQSIHNGLDFVVGAALDVVGGILGAYANFYQSMWEIGTNIIRGLWDGVNSMVGWLMGQINAFCSSVLNKITGFFGGTSNSRAISRSASRMIDSMAEGIRRNANAPIDAMRSLSRGMTGELDDINGLTLSRQVDATINPHPADPQGASGDVIVSVQIDQVVNSAGEDVRLLAQRVAAEIGREINRKKGVFA